MNTEKEIYKPVTVIPPIPSLRLPFQANFNNFATVISLSLGTKMFSGAEMAIIWWYVKFMHFNTFVHFKSER
jgi:hypothetical protein